MLGQSTLWPEVHKLYGHGNDVYSLAACPRGTALVSSSKAQSAASAELRVWDCRHPDFVQAQVLPGHKLTVTQLRYSADGRFLLSASRDRSVCIYRAIHLEAGADPHALSSAAPWASRILHRIANRIDVSSEFGPVRVCCAERQRPHPLSYSVSCQHMTLDATKLLSK